MFQPSWAALTFFCAVSRVKGGKGGLDSLAIVQVSGGFVVRRVELKLLISADAARGVQ